MNRKVRGKALLRLILQYLQEGVDIEIDGLGGFRMTSSDEVVFHPSGRIRVFLAYAEEDRAEVKRIYDALRKAGFEPWMDQEKLLPGQNWPKAIERAIDISDFFVCCFSSKSVRKRGFFQSELQYALTAASKIPSEEIFFLPVRLNKCSVPRDIAKRVQHVDLFPDWERGLRELMKAMWFQTGSENRREI